MPRKLPRLAWLAAPLAYFLYFFRLTGTGLLGPDEPRYAAIGREMARSGDWVTPRLWGQPWFEKPALLYWMTGAAFKVGLGPDLAPRLPVALLSVGFLGFYWWALDREFGCRAAGMACLILASSAAWIGFSQVGVTDLPMAATFAAAMLLALPWIARRDARYLPAAAAMLGLAVLAKGLLPLALAAPVLYRARWWRDLLRPRLVVPFLAIALPWYVLCFWRNGGVFLHDFILVHHLQRFTSAGLQHVQPWWFYLPRLPALVLPWAPLLVLLVRRREWTGARERFLLAWVVFGLAFLSASTNKLPSYLLPLVPAIAALAAIELDRLPSARGLLAGCALLLAAFAVVEPVFPAAVANEWALAPRLAVRWTWFLAVVPAAAAWRLEARGKRLAAVALVAAGAAAGVCYLKIAAAPELARLVNARALAAGVIRHPGAVCLENVTRQWKYGLDYYAGADLPDCGGYPRPYHVVQASGSPPGLVFWGSPGGTRPLPEAVDPQ